jgi:hypothetical protein
VRSCVSRLVWVRESLLVASRKLFEGRVGSMALTRLYRFERVHHRLMSFDVICLICCLVADRLLGREFLRNFGRRYLSLDLNSTAALASSSAASVPVDPMWPATQVSVIENGLSVRCHTIFTSSSLISMTFAVEFLCTARSCRSAKSSSSFHIQESINSWMRELEDELADLHDLDAQRNSTAKVIDISDELVNIVCLPCSLGVFVAFFAGTAKPGHIVQWLLWGSGGVGQMVLAKGTKIGWVLAPRRSASFIHKRNIERSLPWLN